MSMARAGQAVAALRTLAAWSEEGALREQEHDAVVVALVENLGGVEHALTR
jgi:hypothetical protein